MRYAESTKEITSLLSHDGGMGFICVITRSRIRRAIMTRSFYSQISRSFPSAALRMSVRGFSTVLTTNYDGEVK